MQPNEVKALLESRTLRVHCTLSALKRLLRRSGKLRRKTLSNGRSMDKLIITGNGSVRWPSGYR